MLSDSIRDFIRYYRVIRNEKFSHDEFTEAFTYGLSEDLANDLELSDYDYVIKGSVGQGGWAEIPWIAIMHRGVTETTQYGYYIALLFSSDMNELFVSLGLGWTQFLERYGTRIGRANALKCSERFSKALNKSNNDIVGPIDLGARTARGRGYEVSSIIAAKLRTYPLKDIELLNTINRFLEHYRHLREEFGSDVFYGLEGEKLPDDYKEVIKLVRNASTQINKKVRLLA